MKLKRVSHKENPSNFIIRTVIGAGREANADLLCELVSIMPNYSANIYQGFKIIIFYISSSAH